MANNKESQKNTSMTISIVLFFMILGIGSIVSFIMPLRPKVSEVEKRELTAFPTFTVSGFLNGHYMSGVGLWYSDSFPGREYMIAADDNIKKYYGLNDGPKVIGTSYEADEIPDFEDPYDVANNSSPSEQDVNDTEDSSYIEPNPDDLISSEDTVVDEDYTQDEDYSDAEAPNSKAMEAEIKQYINRNLYVKDGAAHSLYYFSNKAATRYTGIIEKCAEELDGKANVYNILVANSSGVMLPEDELAALGGSNQADAVHYYYSLYNKATGIESVDILRQHNDEYLYFRTDHHWTALGAYYVYRNYCKAKGWEPHELDYYTKMTFSPFLGSYYSTLKDPAMAANPDYVEAFIPKGTNKLTYYSKSGKETEYDVIHDVTNWSEYTKYNCFIGGDQPMQKIENPVLWRKTTSCLVIKESYGNCFVPFLVDHYHTVYVMDYRYCNEDVLDFVDKHGIDDVIVINNISIIGSGGVMSKLEKMLN